MKSELLYVKFASYENLTGYMNFYDIPERDVVKIDRRGKIVEMVFRNNVGALQHSTYTLN